MTEAGTIDATFKSSAELAADEREVDQVLFVVDSDGVHDGVDAELEGLQTLGFASGMAGGYPVAEIVAFPGGAKAVLTIQQRGAVPDVHALEVGIDDAHTAEGADKVVGAKDGMIG